MSEVVIATRVDRIWHWVHAIGIVVLAVSGFQIHFPQQLRVFESLADAIAVHEFFGWLVIADFAIWLGYNLATRRIRFYLPGREDLLAGALRQARYYASGIFRRAPHPFEADGVTRKFNPLQKHGYLGLMFVLIPVQVVTGVILYQYTRNWETLDKALVREISVVHTVASYLVLAFLIAHLYLATTGPTLSAHFKMMITGRAEHPHGAEAMQPREE